MDAQPCKVSAKSPISSAVLRSPPHEIAACGPKLMRVPELLLTAKKRS